MRRLAIVVDNKDPDKQGKVLLKILPEFSTFSDDKLPWATPKFNSPFGLLIEDGGNIHKIPEVDSYVYCDISEDWTSFQYSEEIPYLLSVYSYDDVLDIIKNSIDELGDNEYPQPFYEKTKDGSILFRNTDTGELGFISPSGFSFHLKEDGSFEIRTEKTFFRIGDKGEIVMESDGFSLTLDSENKKLIIDDIDKVEIGGASDVAVLFEPLKEILEKLLDHNHIAPTGPTTPAQEASGALLSVLKSKIQNMKSIINTD